MAAIEKCTLELDGIFDLSAALQMADALAWVKPGGEVQVDFTRVRDFHDAGLAVLAQTIQRTGPEVRIQVRGLRARQHRLLRYLGLDLGGPGAEPLAS